jgi:hypothetical protein
MLTVCRHTTVWQTGLRSQTVSTQRVMGEAERTSFGFAADCPPLAWVDDLASELDHPNQRGRNVRDTEVRERYAVAWAIAARMDAELSSALVRLDAGSLSIASFFQLDSKELLPEALRPFEVVGGEFDQI